MGLHIFQWEIHTGSENTFTDAGVSIAVVIYRIEHGINHIQSS